MLQCLKQSSCYPPCPGRQRPAFQKDVGPSKKKLKWRPEFWYLVLKVQIIDRPVFPSAIVQVLPVLPRTPDNRNADAMLLMPPNSKVSIFFIFIFLKYLWLQTTHQRVLFIVLEHEGVDVGISQPSFLPFGFFFTEVFHSFLSFHLLPFPRVIPLCFFQSL